VAYLITYVVLALAFKDDAFKVPELTPYKRLSFQVSFYPSFQVFLAKGQAKGRLTLNATNGFNFETGSPAMLLEQ